MRSIKTLSIHLVLVLLGAAAATAWPSIAGSWDVFENSGSKTGTLVLTQHTSSALCVPISGTLTPTGKPATQVVGSYCVTSGRIHFVREKGGNAFQAWFGNATDDNNCNSYFAGSIARLTGKTGTLGEVAFLFRRPAGCT